MDSKLHEAIVAFCGKKNWALETGSDDETNKEAFDLLMRYAKFYKPLFLRNYYLLYSISEGMVKSFDLLWNSIVWICVVFATFEKKKRGH